MKNHLVGILFSIPFGIAVTVLIIWGMSLLPLWMIFIMILLAWVIGFALHEFSHYFLYWYFGGKPSLKWKGKILPIGVNLDDVENYSDKELSIAGGFPIVFLGTVFISLIILGLVPEIHLESVTLLFILFILSFASGVSPVDFLSLLFPREYRRYYYAGEYSHLESFRYLKATFKR